MNYKEIQERIDSLYYWDSRVISLECNDFGDEVILTYEDDNSNVVYHFKFCYMVSFEHATEYNKDKPVKQLNRLQLPYFLQDVEVKQCDNSLYYCKISMPPLALNIKCGSIQVNKI